MEPQEFNQIFYNEPIYWLEQRWRRKLSAHERTIVELIYRWTRTTQEAEEIKILDHLKKAPYDDIDD
ncbi:hypothetical protein V7114_20820 [Neobacillus niacini]|uniref:hypothetical protein n=1 Tax=Neobacillus niacini TaxID=86668 RepID=UPI002FFDB094